MGWGGAIDRISKGFVWSSLPLPWGIRYSANTNPLPTPTWPAMGEVGRDIVTKSSLGDRIIGRVVPGSTSGPATYLSTAEEDELVMFLCRCASIGYAKSRKEVLAIVQRILDYVLDLLALLTPA